MTKEELFKYIKCYFEEIISEIYDLDLSDPWDCPYCGKHYQVNFDKYDYYPKCGHDLINEVICTYPPIPRKFCPNCGWSWEGERDEIVRVPFGGNSLLMRDNLNAK